MNPILAFVLGLAVVLGGPAIAAEIYVVPPGTATSGVANGTSARPFVGVKAAFDSGKVKAGDTLLLKDGMYGSVDLSASFTSPVVIQSMTEKRAHFDWIQLSGAARNITLKNLSVWPRNPSSGRDFLVRSFEQTSDIKVVGLDIRSEVNAAEFWSWSAAKWNSRKYSGILLQGPRSLVSGNKLTGINFGISIASGQIVSNRVNGFSGDAVRSGSDSIVKRNHLFNCFQIDGNHADGFQAWAGAEPLRNLTLDSNTIIEWTRGDSSHPLRCSLQGIGLYDGPYVNLKILNNVVSVSHFHGISVYGARGLKIINNTVVHVFGQIKQEPWIGIFDNKSGAPSTDVLVANNAAMRYLGGSNAANRVVFRSNSVIGSPGTKFMDVKKFDYRPRANTGLVDSADASVAPLTDIVGSKRPSGIRPDRGAYELQPTASSATAPNVADDTDR
jgi:hypothetical protein